MGGKGKENTKKASGNAKKAEAAAIKQAAIEAVKATEENQKWQQGAKSNAKKDDAAAKKAEADRKKAEKAELLRQEEEELKSAKKGNAKSAQKKYQQPSRGLDLSQLDASPGSSKAAALNASGIDNALDALSLTGSNDAKVDRHPERRVKAAYAAFEARRLPEIQAENPGLRRQQAINLVRKEFDKSDENPFNQAHVSFDTTREELAQLKASERTKIETRLAGDK
ncbi:hypothetical protein FQN57_004694 [Myotisia sp. PD_48]|nr:hypothetical protein FQN57_004694 [Myotisia sp. PD_48]